MITLIPWPELARTARRILRADRHGEWYPSGIAFGSRPVRVRYYPSASCTSVVLAARREDLPQLLASPGILKVSPDGDETLLVKFVPSGAVEVKGMRFDTLYRPHRFDMYSDSDGAAAETVLILGHVETVELQVPSHAIDVIAEVESASPVASAISPFGLN